MSAFAGAVRTMFRDRNMTVPATWRARGVSHDVALRAIRKSPDALSGFGDASLVSDQTVVDVMVADAPTIAPGDLLIIGAEWFVVQSEPMRDRERLVWTLDLRQVPPQP
ncbi:head-tail joining protein [Paracoccus chinensis]|uniref:Phage Head-Tail Attachment n=1 Tax=Paracoccus chinensis TaxID=525640 RepID=A0A1G9JHI0_9RHOB|nr:hypothetical protein [Paracoccus chinensis]SDL37049.1 hypothetical protein SAMN04487971_109140 [Paracoccus chinensis]